MPSLAPALILTLAATVPAIASISGSHDLAIMTNTGSLVGWSPAGLGNPSAVDARFAGIEFVGGRLLGLTTLASPAAPNHASSLVEIDPASGAILSARPVGFDNIREGDLAYDPLTNTLIGSAGGPGTTLSLLSIDADTGAASVLGPSLNEWNGLSFDDTGRLFALRSGTAGAVFVELDPRTGDILADLSDAVAAVNPDRTVNALDFDPARGVFYAAGARTADPRTQSLIEIDLTSRAAREVAVFEFGTPGLPGSGFAGLAVLPATGTPAFAAPLGLAAARRARRRTAANA